MDSLVGLVCLLGGHSKAEVASRMREEPLQFSMGQLVNTLLGVCKLEVREQVEEELLTFSMDENMKDMVNPLSGHMEVGSFACS